MNKFEFKKEEVEIVCEREGIEVATVKNVKLNSPVGENSLSMVGEVLFDKTTKELFDCDEESLLLPFDIIIKEDSPITLSAVELLIPPQFDEEGKCVQQKIDLNNSIIFVTESMSRVGN